MLTVHGRVISEGDGSFAGYAVLAAYRVSVPLADANGGDTIAVPNQISVPVAADGAFSVLLPDEALPPVGLAVVSPAGGRLATVELSEDELHKPVEILADPFTPFDIEPSASPTLGQVVRLTARVIDEGGRDVPADLPVVLWGVGGPDAPSPDPRPLVITGTAAGGSFAADWPADVVDEAYGSVAGQDVPIPLHEGRLPTRILLVADLAQLGDAAGADCACSSDAPPPVAPGAADLAADPAAYAQDLGGGCVNLTTPNRVLEEFIYTMVVRTTDPQMRGVTLPPDRPLPSDVHRLLVEVLATTGLPRIAGGAGNGDESGGDLLLREGDAGPRTSAATARALKTVSVDAANELLRSGGPLDATSLHRAVLRDETGKVLSLIDALRRRAPQRSPLDGADPVDWDDTPTLYEATTVAHGHLLQIRQVWRAAGYSLGDLRYSLPLAPGQKRLVAVLDWERRTSSGREERLDEEEQLDALVARDRDIAEIAGSRLTEDTRGGSDSSTWGVAGGIGAGFLSGAFGIFGGVAGGASGASSNAWQSSARDFSANSLQQLSDRTTQRASSVRDMRSTVVTTVAQGETVSAETEVVANHNHCHAISMEYFEVLRHFLVSHELADVRECLFVPLPMRPFDRAKALRWREPLQRFLRDGRLSGGFDALERIARNWVGYDFPLHSYAEEAPEVLEGELRISFVLPRPRDAQDGAFQVDMWNWLAPLLDTAPFALWTAQLAARDQAARDAYFLSEVAPGVAQNLVAKLQCGYVMRDGTVVPVSLDATLVSRYAESVPLYVSLRPAGALPGVAREDVSRFEIAYEGDDLPPDARVIVHTGKLRYSTEHLTHLLFDEPRILNDLRPGDPVVVATPLDRAELRDPRAEDRKLADELVAHLNEYLEYYHQVIWVSMDAARRYLLLDGAIAPNSGGRSVASVVENRLVGVVGNCLVMPVAPGNHLDPTLADGKRRASLIDAYAVDAPPPIRISVPTRGVYAEAVMGSCESCEKKDDTRFWRWEESPIPDEPTAIAPLSTDSRAADDAAPKPTQFAQPLVAIQNAPELPDPLGLQQAFSLLGQSNLFQDAAGLEGTQKNALVAFQSALSTAKSLGGEASRLAQQQSASRTVDRQLDQITAARDAGLLTPQQAQDAAHAALSNLVGTPAKQDAPPTSSPAVQQAIDAAAQSESGSVDVTTPDESVSATFSGAGAVGSGTAVNSEDLPATLAWASVPMTLDEQNLTSAGVWTYTAPVGSRDLSGFTSKFKYAPIRDGAGNIIGVGRLAAGLITKGLVQPDPADATKFQAKMRVHITFPANPKNLNQIAGTGRLPIAVLVHGHHDHWKVGFAGAPNGTETISGFQVDGYDVATVTEVDNHLGYTYLQEELAKQGIVSISVDTNFANFTGSLIETRADMALEALRIMKRLDGDASSKYHDRLDFSKVGLMGHSRGGDAVVRAARKNASFANAVDKFGIRTVCSLSPTDYAGPVAVANRPHVMPTDTNMYAVVYGSLDGDVSGVGGALDPAGTGFRHYDRARCSKAMVFLRNCNHNRFNRTWSTDDWGTSPAQASKPRSRPDHERLSMDYIGGLMRWQLKGESSQAGLFSGDVANSLGADAVRQWAFGTLQTIDDFEDPNSNNLSEARTVTHGTLEDYVGVIVDGKALAENVPHQTTVLDVPMLGPLLDEAVVEEAIPFWAANWASFHYLLLSIAAAIDVTDETTINAGVLPGAKVTITDLAGNAATVETADFLDQPQAPYYHETRDPRTAGAPITNATALALQTLRVPLSAFQFTGVDLTNVAAVSLQTIPLLGTTVFYDKLELAQV